MTRAPRPVPWRCGPSAAGGERSSGGGLARPGARGLCASNRTSGGTIGGTCPTGADETAARSNPGLPRPRTLPPHGNAIAMNADRRRFLAASLSTAAALAGAPRIGSGAAPEGKPGTTTAATPAPAAPAGKRPAHILLRNSWQTVNIGDVGHTPGMLRLIGQHLAAGTKVTLQPSRVDAPEERMLKARFPDLAIARTAAEVARAHAECDFLLHGSGPSLVGAKQVADWKAKTGKPYGIAGITLGSVDKATGELLDGAAFVYLRDSISTDLVRKAGVKSPVVEFGPDAAFAVDLRDDKSATEFLSRHGLEEGKFVVAIPRLRYTPYWLIHGTVPTAEQKGRIRINADHADADHAILRTAVTALVKEAGMKVLLCPEDRSHIAVGKEWVFDKLPEDVRRHVVHRPDWWLTDEALSTYVRSAGLVSFDMHSPIMAVGNGVPAIHCRFKEQTSKGVMWRDVGLGEWLFDLDEQKDGGVAVAKAALEMVRDAGGAKKKAAAARDKVAELQAGMMKQVAKHLPA